MENIDSLFKKMLDYKEAVMRIFAGVDKKDLDALMNVLKPENKRAEYEMAYNRITSYNVCYTKLLRFSFNRHLHMLYL